MEVEEERPCSATQQTRTGLLSGGGTRVEVAERGRQKMPGDQFHGSLPEEALVMLKQRVTLLLNRV
jgi:hypothetical protein